MQNNQANPSSETLAGLIRFAMTIFVGAIMMLACSGCFDPAATRTAMIEDLVGGAQDHRQKVLAGSEGTLVDYKVYRDGEADGVIFEYIVDDKSDVDKSKFETGEVKKDMLTRFGNDEKSKQFLALGIHIRFLYTTPSGETISDTKIGYSDLNIR